MATLPSAVRLLETRRFEDAAAALEPLAGGAGDGVIARFRRAEALSRLGRHDDAVAEARRAHEDAPGAPATALWLAQALAEAGRFDEAAAVTHPAAQAEFVAPVAAGYGALARLASAGSGAEGLGDAAGAILESRHAPLYSLALRVAERRRLAGEPRWPDLPPVFHREECRLEQEEEGRTEHAPAPVLTTREGFLGRTIRRLQAAEAVRWLRLHASCGDRPDLIDELRAAGADAAALDEVDLEMRIAHGRLDAAEALAERLAKDAGADAAGELAVDRCRIAQLRGRPARPRDFDGGDDAARRLRPYVDWLELCAALLEERPLEARSCADRLSDPSHREFVEAALLRATEGTGMFTTETQRARSSTETD